MPRKLQLHVERNRVKGKNYYSFRIGKGARIKLPDDPTSAEFKAAYIAALTGEPVKRVDKHTRTAPGTIAAVIASYKSSADYIALRQSSKKAYDSRLEAIREDHGHRTIGGLTRERIYRILQVYADRPGAATDTLKKFRILIRHAINVGLLKFDPSLGIKRPKLKRIRSWTDAEIATFREYWPLGTKQRTAFELFLNTGQRRSDVYRMAWPHITAENKIKVVQLKTGAALLIPLHRDLQAALAVATREHVMILTTAHGKPFSADGFSHWMREAIAAAGLPLDAQPHGLRKAAGRRLAEAGASTKEIAAILGHKTLSEIERYTEDAAQEALAEAAVIRLEQHKANMSSQTASESLGKPEKKTGESK